MFETRLSSLRRRAAGLRQNLQDVIQERVEQAVSGRGLKFRAKSENRYWWHHLAEGGFTPPLYAFLTHKEWELLEAWFQDTDQKVMHGECNVSALSTLQGLVMGSGLHNLVEIGCYAGYSTLLFGFMFRRMGFKRAMYTIDVEPRHCDYTRSWVTRAGLEEYVHIECNDSSAAGLPAKVRDHFARDIDSVFIDSSHQYEHTCRELELWPPAVRVGGFVFLHDTSANAAGLDQTQKGGVHRAFAEWTAKTPNFTSININGAVPPGVRWPYPDNCGLGICQRQA